MVIKKTHKEIFLPLNAEGLKTDQSLEKHSCNFSKCTILNHSHEEKAVNSHIFSLMFLVSS